jgi:hypothetical protein
MDLCFLLLFSDCHMARGILLASQVTIDCHLIYIDCPPDLWGQIQHLIDALAPCRVEAERVIFACGGEYRFSLAAAAWA